MGITFDVAEKLFPNLATMIVQLCSSGILFYVAYRFLWNPAREYLAKKSELTQKELREAQAAKLEANRDLKTAKQKLTEASYKAKDIVEKGKDEGKIIKESIIRDGRQQADQLLKSAREEIAFEQNKMRQGMQKEIVDVALLATEKLMKEQADEQQNRKSIVSFVEGMNADE
ncbi:MAG: F0F1 ATP synthase subunit B [Erysipelotrichaceae bacterium]|nr:F0F1 ATP synthase subunit B [Erysipelotrichaceae bacterium]